MVSKVVNEYPGANGINSDPIDTRDVSSSAYQL